jgi:hypothetical protein
MESFWSLSIVGFCLDHCSIDWYGSQSFLVKALQEHGIQVFFLYYTLVFMSVVFHHIEHLIIFCLSSKWWTLSKKSNAYLGFGISEPIGLQRQDIINKTWLQLYWKMYGLLTEQENKTKFQYVKALKLTFSCKVEPSSMFHMFGIAPPHIQLSCKPYSYLSYQALWWRRPRRQRHVPTPSIPWSLALVIRPRQRSLSSADLVLTRWSRLCKIMFRRWVCFFWNFV